MGSLGRLITRRRQPLLFIGCILSGKRGLNSRLVLFAQPRQPRAHGQQQHQQHRQQHRAITHQPHKPGLFVETGRFDFGAAEFARHNLHHIAALRVRANGGAHQRLQPGGCQRGGSFKRFVIHRDCDRKLGQPAGTAIGDGHLAAQFIGALHRAFGVVGAGLCGRGRLGRAIHQCRIRRRGVGSHPRNAAGRALPAAGGIALAFTAHHAEIIIGFARAGDFFRIKFGLHLRGIVPLAQERQQQRVNLADQLGFKFALQGERFERILARGRQQPPVLIDHAHFVTRHPRNRGGNQIHNRFDLTLRQAPPAGEPHHNRRAGCARIAHKH